MSSKKARKTGKVDREQLIAAIRAAVEAGGGKPLSMQKFFAVSKLKMRAITRNFPKWSDAMKAAGFDFEKYPRRVTSEQLMADWGETARKLGHIPTFREYAILGRFNQSVLKRRFGGRWVNILSAFRSFAMKNQHWVDVLTMLPRSDQKVSARRKKMPGRRGTGLEQQAAKEARMESRQISGDPLYLEGISHAPVNETGVVLLFGAMAARLGFMVESVRANFPDCQAKRRIGPDAWLTLRIEFEYESRNFRDHGHHPEGCDMIVCWVHNWSDCPQRLKVIALSEELARLRRERSMIAF
jgi:hypothetical protein